MAILIVGSSRISDIFNNLGIKTINLKEFKEKFKNMLKSIEKNETFLVLVEDIIYKEVEDFIKNNIDILKILEEDNKKLIILEIPTKEINYKEMVRKYLGMDLNI